MLRTIIVFACLALFCFVQPARSSENPWTHTVYFENDLFTGTDSNYTNGVKYSVISPDLSRHAPDGQLPRKILGIIHDIPFINESGPEYTHKVEFALGQNMFTPSDIVPTGLITNDRPYAGWLYVSTSYHRKNSAREELRFMDTVEIQLGLVGPESFTEETQTIVHKLRDIQTPKGWDNQLKNEPGVAIIFERKWLYQPGRKKGPSFNAVAHAGGALGNVHTYLNTGLETRLGYNVPENFGVSLIRPAGSTRLSIPKDFSMFVFGAVNGKAVLRDIFLDGNTFTDSHSVDKEHFVADLAAGFAVSFKNFMITWTQVLRTKEFKLQSGSHSFGSLAVSFSVPFDLRSIFDKW